MQSNKLYTYIKDGKDWDRVKEMDQYFEKNNLHLHISAQHRYFSEIAWGSYHRLPDDLKEPFIMEIGETNHEVLFHTRFLIDCNKSVLIKAFIDKIHQMPHQELRKFMIRIPQYFSKRYIEMCLLIIIENNYDLENHHIYKAYNDNVKYSMTVIFKIWLFFQDFIEQVKNMSRKEMHFAINNFPINIKWEFEYFKDCFYHISETKYDTENQVLYHTAPLNSEFEYLSLLATVTKQKAIEEFNKHKSGTLAP